MAKIGILTCSNVTQELGCSSVSCLADLRKRRGTFASYPASEPLDLVGIINCPGCPTLVGPAKLLQRIKALTEFRVDVIHFTFCIKALCPFRDKYEKAINEEFPDVTVVIGTHQEHVTCQEYRDRVEKLFSQPLISMVDMILNRDQK
jgi:predicted metal-binding protein